MANPYSAEINWWKSRAAEFDTKRAQLQPFSYANVSQAYSSRKNYNGAATLDSMRLSIYRQAAVEDAKNAEEIRNMVYTKPLTAAEKKAKEEAAAKAAALRTVIKPSEGVTELDSQVDRLQDKLKGIGSDVGRTLVGGFSAAMDLISRTTYAMQEVRADAVKSAKASGNNISMAEHIGIALKPALMLTPAAAAATAVAGGSKSVEEGYSAFVRGISGKSRTTGIDVIREQFPNWAKEHNALANVAGFGSDILSDPLTYLTMGSGTTVAKTGGAVGARLTGNKALARALMDETVLTKAGRTAGKATFKQNVQASKIAKATKTEAKAVKSAGKQAGKAEKAATKGAAQFSKKKISRENLDELTANYGKAEGRRLVAMAEMETAQKIAAKAELRGIADTGRYMIKHPFKSVGSYGQGMRTGSALKGTAEAKAAHAAVVAKAAEGLKQTDWAPLVWSNNLGTEIKYKGGVFKVSDDFDTFTKDLAGALQKFNDVRQTTRRAARGRYGVLAQAKAEQYDLISKLNDLDWGYNSAKPYAENLVSAGSPFSRAAVSSPEIINVDPAEVDAVVGGIAEAKAARAASQEELLSARAPESVNMDNLNGLSEAHIAAREHYKGIAQRIFDERGIANEGGVLTDPNTRAVGDFAAEGSQGINYTREQNLAVAQAVADSVNEAIHSAAIHDLLSDPVNIVNAYMDVTNDLLNKVSADTHVQVLEYLRYKHGMSMPSMAMPLNHVDKLYASGDIFKGTAEDTAAVAKHFSDYLSKQITDAIGGTTGMGTTLDPQDYWQMLDVLDFSSHVQGSTRFTANKQSAMQLMQRLKQYQDDLEWLHYGQEVPAADKFTLLDHMVFGKSGIDELATTDSKIGRLSFVSDSINTNGIPAYNPQVLKDLGALDDLEATVISAYSRYARMDEPPFDNFVYKTEEQIKEMFTHIRRNLAEPDLRRVAPGGVVDPRMMLHSLGTHLDLLHSTTDKANFGVAWRRQIASNVWGIPARKVDGKFEPGVWSSASLMADLNEAVSVGILNQTLVKRLTPEQVSDWLAKIAKENPELEKVLRQADLDGVRAHGPGAGKKGGSPEENIMEARLPDEVNAQTAQKMTDADTPPNTPEETLQTSAMEDATNKASSVPPPMGRERLEGLKAGVLDEAQAARDARDALPPSPGGFAAPEMTAETANAIQKTINELMDSTDVISFNHVMGKMQSDMLAWIAKYDAKMQDTLGQFQIATSQQIRVMGMPIVSLPAMNTSYHTNAGVHSLIQDLPRHLTANARRTPGPEGSATLVTQQKWFSRPTSKLDESMRQIMQSVSGHSNYFLKMLMNETRTSYLQFKNKGDLHSSVRDFFDMGVSKVDPRLDETVARFNDAHNYVMGHASEFTGKDIDYGSSYVRNSVAALFNGLGGGFKIPTDEMKKFSSQSPLFDRQWFADLADFLAKSEGSLSNHPLSGKRLQNMDMASFEFQFQHTMSKLRVKNETVTNMIETFGAPMRRDVVDIHNMQPEVGAYNNKLINVGEAFGKSNVPDHLKNHYVEQSVAEQMKKVMDFTQQAIDHRNNKVNYGIMRDINNYWKAGVTIFSGRYHVGNAMSDGFMSMIDGVRPQSYKKAIATIVTDSDTAALWSDPNFQKTLNQVLSDAGSSMGPEDAKVFQETLEFIKGHGPNKPVSTVFVGGRQVSISSAEYQKRFRQYGLDQNNVVGNIKRGTENMVSPVGRTTSTVTDAVQEFSARREDYFRMSHFIHAFEQEAKVAGRTLDDAWLAARDRVMHWHFDYDNVTEFEKNFVSPVAPFYKWTRNIVPLSFSVFFTNPKAYTIGNAANRALGQMMFPTQEDSNGEEIPLDIVVPRWITEQGAVPIGTYTDPEGNQQLRYAVLNLPFDQAMVRWFSPFSSAMGDPEASAVEKYVRQPGQGVAGSAGATMHPLIEAGFAAATGNVPTQGGPFREDDWWAPLLGMLYSGTGVLGEFAKSKTESSTKNTDPFSAPSLLDNVGITRGRDVTEGAKKGELLQQKERLSAILQKKGDAWMRERYPNIDPQSEQGKEILHDHYVSIGVLKQ